ncbi:MAG: pyruvate formate lyase family protein [Anaerolineae bacterium]
MGRIDSLLSERYTAYEPTRGEPFHEAWLAHATEPPTVRLAHALVAQWHGARRIVAPHELLVGRLELQSVVSWRCTRALQWNQSLWDTQYNTADDARRAALELLRATWLGHSGEEIVWSALTPTEKELGRVHSCDALGAHASPLYVRFAEEGAQGLRQRVAASRQAHAGMPGTEPGPWYDALEIVLAGIERFGDLYAETVREEAARECDPTRRVELEDVAARCARVLRNPAQTFHDALQAYWFASLLYGVDSPGRFDQDLGPFLERDLRAERITLAQAQELVDEIWIKFARNRAWSLTLSGQRPEGGDATNTLTWLCMDAMRRLRTDAPNVSLRIHAGTPPELKRQAYELLASGYSMPALVNDEPVIASMLERGISETHARDYTLVGCTQVVPRGRCGGAYEDLTINALKCLELALHDGVDPATGVQLGPHTGHPNELLTYDAVEAACMAQIDFMVHATAEMVNRQSVAVAQHYDCLFRSLTIEGCLEKGRDYRRGGPVYNEGRADVLGITNIADALLVIRELVFDQRRVALPQLVQILDTNWEGEEALRQEALHRVAKFGNGDPQADALTVKVFNRINEGYRAVERVYGRERFGIDVVGWTGSVDLGKRTGATPDGRHHGAPLCDSVGPSQGNDRRGVTAVLGSVAALPHDRAHGILALNLRFSGSTFHGIEGLDKLGWLVETAFAQGVQQLQINVVSADTLRAAQTNPEAYQSLTVRIGGYSTYFNWLSKAHQDDIISRTEHTV